jgi:hypothetical protein
MLNQLADLIEQRDAVVAAHPLRERYLALKVEVADCEAAFAHATEAHYAQIAGLKAQIEERVLDLGQTVKGAAWMAVWTRPRITYEVKLLEGFVLAHPELLAARRVGRPSVSIKAVKEAT